MPPRARRPSAVRTDIPAAAVSPPMVTAPSHPTTLPPRRYLESDFDYASRLYATELLRPAHVVESNILFDRQTKQIAELEELVSALSDKQRAILLKRYEDMAGRQVRLLNVQLANEVFWRWVRYYAVAAILAAWFVMWLWPLLVAFGQYVGLVRVPEPIYGRSLY
ncbi:hypothetical protein LTR85_011532 [Meristemomyces frigidus]|nr:hypothetical protein LTR85_011532 [Meristemomyces frigidus]